LGFWATLKHPIGKTRPELKSKYRMKT